MKTNCLSCRGPLGCGSVRQLCPKCYQKARTRIKKGLTTWTQLVAEGKALVPFTTMESK